MPLAECDGRRSSGTPLSELPKRSRFWRRRRPQARVVLADDLRRSGLNRPRRERPVPVARGPWSRPRSRGSWPPRSATSPPPRPRRPPTIELAAQRHPAAEKAASSPNVAATTPSTSTRRRCRWCWRRTLSHARCGRFTWLPMGHPCASYSAMRAWRVPLVAANGGLSPDACHHSFYPRWQPSRSRG